MRDIACYCRWGTAAELHVNPTCGEEAAAPTSDIANDQGNDGDIEDDLEPSGSSDEDDAEVDERGRKARLNHIEASPDESTSESPADVMARLRRSTQARST